MDQDLAAAIEGERRLLTPSVRRSAVAVSALLHPDFHEFGASGRRWTREAIIAALESEPPEATAPEVADLRAVRLAESVIQVTYVTRRPERAALRSSLWRKDADGTWLMCFHQGTVVTGE